MTSSLVPNYEVKALLNTSAVVDSDNQLKSNVLSKFFTQPEIKQFNVQFLDTVPPEQNIFNNGWNLRIRKMEGRDEFELTYKKRYKVGVGPLSNDTGNIAAMLKTAEQAGFDSTYEAQVEVGYNSQTLSISYDKEVSSNGFQGTDLPLVEDSRKFLTDNAPQEFSNWDTGYLNQSIIYGPVLATRFKGEWNGLKLSIEVWPIRKCRDDPTLEPIVEASFKASSVQKALDGQDKLIGFLQQKDWFLAKNSLKTELIMERYGNVQSNVSASK